jgi:hypothetical protein
LQANDVQFDLENWFISTKTGELNIIKGKKQIVCSVPKDLPKP